MRIKDLLLGRKARGVYFVILFLICLFLFDYFCIGKKTYEEDMFEAGTELNFLSELQSGDMITQQFTFEQNTLEGLRIAFATFENTKNNEGELRCSLLDDDTGTLIQTKLYDISKIQDNSYLTFMLDQPLGDCKGKNLSFIVEILSVTEDTRLTMLLSDEEQYPDTKLFVNNQKNSATIRMKCMYQKSTDTFMERVFFSFVYMAIFLLMCYGFFVIKKNKLKLENIYIIMAMGLGIMYMMWILPMMAPDENSHLATAYHLSNRLLNVQAADENGYIYMRKCDSQTIFSVSMTRDRLSTIYQRYLDTDYDTSMVHTWRKALDVADFQYIISAMGITVGRVFGLNGYITLTIGRFFNLYFAIFGIWYAIKKIPFGKMTMLLLALLPMTLQQCASYSYDAVIIPLSFVVIALILKILYSPVRTKAMDWIVFIITSALLGLCKGGVYLPIVFIVIIGIFKYWKKDRNKSLLIVGSLATIMIILCGTKLLGVGTTGYGSTTQSAYGNYVSWCGEEGYTVSDFIDSPVRIVKLIGDTLYRQCSYYLYTMIGGALGKLDIEIPYIIVYGFLVLLLLSTIQNKGNRKNEGFDKVQVSERVIMVTVALISCAMCIGGMLLAWTPKSSSYVQGVQGRYFIPAIPLVFLGIRNCLFQVKKNIDSVILMSVLLLHCMVFYCIQMHIAGC